MIRRQLHRTCLAYILLILTVTALYIIVDKEAAIMRIVHHNAVTFRYHVEMEFWHQSTK